MRKSTGLYPALRVDATGKRVVSHAGAVVLAATADKAGLGHSGITDRSSSLRWTVTS
jgi:hypothetical protein